jgi:hypothetical protein
LNYLVGKKNGREHLLPEHAQAQANPWQVRWLVSLFSCSCSSLTLPLLLVQGVFDLVNKILNEAGAASAHDAYINLYPAITGRLRPHQDRKQVISLLGVRAVIAVWLLGLFIVVCVLSVVFCLLFVAVRYVQSEYSLFKRR